MKVGKCNSISNQNIKDKFSVETMQKEKHENYFRGETVTRETPDPSAVINASLIHSHNHIIADQKAKIAMSRILENIEELDVDTTRTSPHSVADWKQIIVNRTNFKNFELIKNCLDCYIKKEKSVSSEDKKNFQYKVFKNIVDIASGVKINKHNNSVAIKLFQNEDAILQSNHFVEPLNFINTEEKKKFFEDVLLTDDMKILDLKNDRLSSFAKYINSYNKDIAVDMMENGIECKYDFLRHIKDEVSSKFAKKILSNDSLYPKLNYIHLSYMLNDLYNVQQTLDYSGMDKHFSRVAINQLMQKLAEG